VHRLPACYLSHDVFPLPDPALTPIENLKAVMETVASGDLTVKAEVQSRDEIGDLGLQINQMIGSLAGLIGQVKSSSESIIALRTASRQRPKPLHLGRRNGVDCRACGTEQRLRGVCRRGDFGHHAADVVQYPERRSQCAEPSLIRFADLVLVEQMIASIKSVAGTLNGSWRYPKTRKKTVVLGFESVQKSNNSSDEIRQGD